MSRIAAAGLLALAMAGGIAGCGLGAGPGTSDASVNVTQNFGSTQLGAAVQKHVPGSETDMGLLERYFHVITRYGGGFVQSIDGHAGTASRRDWFFYVNGIQASKGAAVTAVHRGDHVWWDLHDWTVTDDVPAVVGAFPEPFTTGTGGQRLPSVLTCASGLSSACDTVAGELRRQGVKVADQSLGTGSGSDSLAVVVGTFSQLRGVIASELIRSGPARSGVYAQFVGSRGQALELDAPTGAVVQTLHGSVGMVAATEQPSLNEPVWLVTGTDAKGVAEAARALTPAALHDHFAVVVTGKRVIPVPLAPAR